MTKRRTFLAVLLGLIVALCLSFAVACGGDEAETATLKWTIEGEKEHVTVTVDESTTLPESFTVGETLTFKVTPDTGYDVAVKVGRSPLSEKNGVYTYSVKKGTTEITVTVSKRVKSVAVTKNPTKLTYFAGEELDPAGMEVTVTYEAGDPDKLTTGYVINYPTSDEGCFLLGDKSFTVSYGNFTSDPVQLTAAVEAKIVINPVGGVIKEEILTAWAARTDIKGYDVEEETGIISFTYSKLDSAIALPNNEEILLGDGKSSTLNGWVDTENGAYTEIGLSNNISLELNANWDLVLVDLQKMELVLEGGKPYLALTMSINTNFSAYAYFYEGNDKVEVKGDEIQGKAGQTVTAKVDITKLQNATSTETGEPFNARGAWMDIRVNTTINGIDLTQTFYYDPEDPVLDYGQMIHDDDYCYRFIHWKNGDGKLELKVYYYDYLTTYYMDVEEVDGKATLKMHGEANTKRQAAEGFNFDGATINITFGSATVTGPVKADGSWEATLDLTTVENNFNATATAVIMTSTDDQTLDLGKGGKLDLNGCGTIFGYNASADNPRNFQNTKVINGWRYTIGCDWNEPFLTAVDTLHEVIIENVTIENVDGVPYYVMTGTCGAGFTNPEDVWATFGYFDIQLNSDQGSGSTSGGSWDVFWTSDQEDNGMQFTLQNGKWTFKVAIPEAARVAGYQLFSHIYDNGTNFEKGDLEESEVVIGDLKYRVGRWYGWNNYPLVTVWVEDPQTVRATGADLVVEGQKVYFVLSGNSEYYQKADLEAVLETIHFDFQNNAYHDNSWDGAWTEHNFDRIVTVANDLTWTIKFDVTELGVHEFGNPYTGHFMAPPAGSTNPGADLKLSAEQAQDGKSVELNGKRYTLVNKAGSDEPEENWGNVSLLVEEIEA